MSEITKRIRKLRWMGMEDEAQKLQMQLACCGVRFPDSVLAAQGDGLNRNAPSWLFGLGYSIRRDRLF